MPRTGAAARPRPDYDDRAETLIEWAELHSRLLTIIAVAIIVIVGGGWFYIKAHQARTQNASLMLTEADQARLAGNLPLAQSDLEKIVSRYSTTSSGDQARLLLAEVLFDRGQYQPGIAQLQQLVASKDTRIVASAYNLMGAGYEQAGEYADAAAAYQKAAAAARFPSDRDTYLANAARTLMTAGKTTEARAIWTKLAADPSSPEAAEARVRLGEMDVKAAKQG